MLGETRKRAFVAELQRLGWGRMFTLRPPTPYEGEPWGFDNGAFIDWRQGVPFDGERFRRRVGYAVAHVEPPYLAVLPDVVGGGRRSLDLSLSWIGDLPPEWPWYLAVQDGMTVAEVAAVLPAVSGLFLGGSNAFKATAATWCALAHAAGKPFHYGRAGVWRKVRHAQEVGADSCDSAFPLWSEPRFRQFIAHCLGGHPQLQLTLE